MGEGSYGLVYACVAHQLLGGGAGGVGDYAEFWGGWAMFHAATPAIGA